MKTLETFEIKDKKKVKRTSGRITAISISKKKGIPKSNVSFANLIADWGIEGGCTRR